MIENIPKDIQKRTEAMHWANMQYIREGHRFAKGSRFGRKRIDRLFKEYLMRVTAMTIHFTEEDISLMAERFGIGTDAKTVWQWVQEELADIEGSVRMHCIAAIAYACLKREREQELQNETHTDE